MGSGQQMHRAKMLQRLYEAQKKKVQEDLDPEEQAAQAASLMDRLVGPQWRKEMELVGVVVTDIPEESECKEVEGEESNDETESFYRRVGKAMEADGFAHDGLEYTWGKSTDKEVVAARENDSIKNKLIAFVEHLFGSKSK